MIALTVEILEKNMLITLETDRFLPISYLSLPG